MRRDARSETIQPFSALWPLAALGTGICAAITVAVLIALAMVH